MNFSLTPHLELFIRDRVASGDYNNASEVVREALRLLRRTEEERALRLKHLRAGRDPDLEATRAGPPAEVAERSGAPAPSTERAPATEPEETDEDQTEEDEFGGFFGRG